MSPIFGAAFCRAITSVLAFDAQLVGVEALQIGDGEQRAQLIDRALRRLRQIGVGRLQRAHEHHLVGEIDAGDVVAHVVERGAAVARFAAIGLALADFIGEARGAVEQALRVERRVVDLHVEVGQVIDEPSGLLADFGGVGAEEPRLDGVEAGERIGPGVDLLVELGDEAAGEHFGALPADPRSDPRLLGAVDILGGDALVERPRAGQRLVDLLDHVGAIALGRVFERRGESRARRGERCGGKRQARGEAQGGRGGHRHDVLLHS